MPKITFNLDISPSSIEAMSREIDLFNQRVSKLGEELKLLVRNSETLFAPPHDVVELATRKIQIIMRLSAVSGISCDEAMGLLGGNSIDTLERAIALMEAGEALGRAFEICRTHAYMSDPEFRGMVNNIYWRNRMRGQVERTQARLEKGEIVAFPCSCLGCVYHNSDKELRCAVHPFGPEGDNCSDFESSEIASADFSQP